MMNKRITAKERGLIKGAIRRAFSRSELRLEAIKRSKIEHTDPTRPRVKKWGICAECKQPTALYQMQIDHIEPIVPLNMSLEEMTWDELINRCWCSVDLLQALCHPCHKAKSKVENRIRRENKKKRDKNE